MKRDLELIRRLLLAIEASEGKTEFFFPEIEGASFAEVSYHTELAAQAGLIKAQDLSDVAGPKWMAGPLTWEGHELLALCRDPETWEQALGRLRRQAGEVDFASLVAELRQVRRQRLV